MLGRNSEPEDDHFVGDEEPALRRGGREPPACCAIEEGFLLSTFREDLPFRFVGAMVAGWIPVGFPNPNLDPELPLPLGRVSHAGLEPGEGARKLGFATPPRSVGLSKGTSSQLDFTCPDICADSPSISSHLAGPDCMYAPCLLVLDVSILDLSPGRVGGSNPDLYDAIMILQSNHSSRC